MSERPKLSGYEYKKQRMQRQGDNERLAQSLSAFLTHDACPSTSNCACAESDEQGPADASESEAPPDTDAVAVALKLNRHA